MKINIEYRSTCRICDGGSLSRWAALPQMPLTDDLRDPGKTDRLLLHDIDVYYCNDCGASQILHQLDMSEYYKDYAYTVANSSVATIFMRNLAKAVYEKYQLSANSKVIEVGSGDGAQLACFKDLGAMVYGYEPALELCLDSRSIGVPVFQGLFDENSIQNIPEEYVPADVLLLTYTFDHIPEPMKFLKAAIQILNPKKGLLVMEVHDLEKIVERKEYCLLEHEHFTYLNENTMQKVLDRAGFKLISSDLLPEFQRRGNSLLVVAAPKSSDYAKSMTEELHTKELGWNRLSSFNQNMHEGISRLDRFVAENVASGKKVAGFGGGGRGVMTTAAMESASQISYLCDNNLKFQGKVTPKTNIPIFAASQLDQEPVDILIVFSFGYIDEIRRQVFSLQNPPNQIISMLEIL